MYRQQKGIELCACSNCPLTERSHAHTPPACVHLQPALRQSLSIPELRRTVDCDAALAIDWLREVCRWVDQRDCAASLRRVDELVFFYAVEREEHNAEAYAIGNLRSAAPLHLYEPFGAIQGQEGRQSEQDRKRERHNGRKTAQSKSTSR